MRTNNRETVAKSSETYFENGMRGHNAVSDIVSQGDNIYLLRRTDDRPDLRVLLVNIYIVGEADIFEIDPGRNRIDCIILVGFHNRYSIYAKELARSLNVGLFTHREFFGAVNCTGKSFFNYEPKRKNK